MEKEAMYSKLFERVIAERPDLAPFADIIQHLKIGGDSSDPESEKKENDLKFRKLATAAKILKEDFDDAMDDLDDLARALGACETCWGENRRCTKCRGNGRSGYFKPDERLFRLHVLPAISKIPWLQVTEIQ